MDIRNLTVPSPSTADPELSERAVRRRFSAHEKLRVLAPSMRRRGAPEDAANEGCQMGPSGTRWARDEPTVADQLELDWPPICPC
jgi:hypothetical protein